MAKTQHGTHVGRMPAPHSDTVQETVQEAVFGELSICLREMLQRNRAPHFHQARCHCFASARIHTRVSWADARR